MGRSKSACREIHHSGSKHWISLWDALIGCSKIPPPPGKFLNLIRCGWIPTGMVMLELGRCSFGVLGVLVPLPSPPLQDSCSQSPECSDRRPGLGPWECAWSGRNRGKWHFPALSLANPLFFPPCSTFLLSLPTYFHPVPPIFSLLHLFSPPCSTFILSDPTFFLSPTLFLPCSTLFYLQSSQFSPYLPLFHSVPPIFSLLHFVFPIPLIFFTPLLFSFQSTFFFFKFVFLLFSLFQLFYPCSSCFSPYSTLFLCNPSLFFSLSHFFFFLPVPTFSSPGGENPSA